MFRASLQHEVGKNFADHTGEFDTIAPSRCPFRRPPMTIASNVTVGSDAFGCQGFRGTETVVVFVEVLPDASVHTTVIV